ncbi:MAG: carbon-nitrogen hydrolase family protein [Bacteroidota bacterium]
MKVHVAVVQDVPVIFDKANTLDKVEALVKKYALEGTQLMLFPESFIPAYPRGADFGAKVGRRTAEGRELYLRYWQESFELGSDDQIRLERIARVSGVFLVIGVTERSSLHGSLFCSMLYISPKQGLVGVHRKIKPTGTERLIWAEAGGDSLITVSSDWGRIGGLICWENYMPLARMVMYQQGVQLYLAPTADSREGWTATMQHIALEGRCFVLAANQCVQQEDYPEEYLNMVGSKEDLSCRGGSLIISPLGEILAGPLYGEKGCLTAEIDLEDIIRAKLDFDPIGHYHRPDIFQFEIKS